MSQKDEQALYARLAAASGGAPPGGTQGEGKQVGGTSSGHIIGALRLMTAHLSIFCSVSHMPVD